MQQKAKKCKVECEIYYRHAEYIFDGLRKPTTSGRVLISNRLDSYVFTFQSIPSACKRKTILAHFAPISGFGSKFQLHISGFLVLSLSNRVACFELWNTSLISIRHYRTWVGSRDTCRCLHSIRFWFRCFSEKCYAQFTQDFDGRTSTHCRHATQFVRNDLHNVLASPAFPYGQAVSNCVW